MPMMARVSRVSGVIAVAAVWSFTASPSGAIVVDLDPAAVKQAVEEGKQMKEVKPDRARKNEKGPAYRGKLSVSWMYGAFDPNAVTKITLYPALGDAMSWEVDFSKIR